MFKHSLTKPTKAVVIGAGIAGCATAYALAQKNIPVTLIERQPYIASGASGNPFAVLYPRLTGQNTALESLNLYGYLHTLNLLQSLGFNASGYQPLGVVQLAMNSKLAKQQAEAMARYADISALNMQTCTAKDLSQIANVTLNRDGLWFASAGGINLAHFCQILTQDARINTVVNTSALALEQTNSKSWQVLDTQKQCIAEADVVVIANGGDALNLAQTAHLPLVSARGQLSYLAQTENSQSLKTIVCGDGYITPSMNGTHYLGATFNVNDNETRLREADHHHNLALLHDMCPTLFSTFSTMQANGRVAWRCQTTDYLPACGQLLDVNALKNGQYFYNDAVEKLPWLTGLYVNVGHGAKGFLSAPLCASMIANNITGTTQNLGETLPNNLLNGLQPSRFILRALGFKALAQKLGI